MYLEDSEDTIGCSAAQIREDASCIYDFLMANFKKLKESDILVLGRSMGSGPSVHLASTRSPGLLILVSSFTSIKNVVYERFGPLSALVSE